MEYSNERGASATFNVNFGRKCATVA